MFSRLRSDVQCILERDPAARTAWEVLTCYPGIHALILHRRAHWCWTHGGVGVVPLRWSIWLGCSDHGDFGIRGLPHARQSWL